MFPFCSCFICITFFSFGPILTYIKHHMWWHRLLSARERWSLSDGLMLGFFRTQNLMHIRNTSTGQLMYVSLSIVCQRYSGVSGKLLIAVFDDIGGVCPACYPLHISSCIADSYINLLFLPRRKKNKCL